MHNQQPWAKQSEKPCLVTYNPITPIDERKIIKIWWFQHIVHDMRHAVVTVQMVRFIQGKRRTRHCGAHTLINSQEHCLITAMVTARQLGADYPFEDDEAKRWFNFYGRLMYGWNFKRAYIPSDCPIFTFQTKLPVTKKYAEFLPRSDQMAKTAGNQS